MSAVAPDQLDAGPDGRTSVDVDDRRAPPTRGDCSEDLHNWGRLTHSVASRRSGGATARSRRQASATLAFGRGRSADGSRSAGPGSAVPQPPRHVSTTRPGGIAKLSYQAWQILRSFPSTDQSRTGRSGALYEERGRGDDPSTARRTRCVRSGNLWLDTAAACPRGARAQTGDRSGDPGPCAEMARLRGDQPAGLYVCRAMEVLGIGEVDDQATVTPTPAAATHARQLGGES